MTEIIMKILEFFSSFGYFGVIFGLAIEVIPSEIVLGFAGYMVLKGELTFWGAVIAGTIGGTIAQLLLYYLGRYGGRPVVERFGKYLLIRPHHLAIAERWFEQYGNGVVFSARFVPVVRHAISIPAGMVKMNVWQFTFYTAIAAVPWSIFFIYIGMKLGENWGAIKESTHELMLPIIGGAVLMVVVYMFYVRWRNKRKGQQTVSSVKKATEVTK